jgi:hypothetical protein
LLCQCFYKTTRLETTTKRRMKSWSTSCVLTLAINNLCKNVSLEVSQWTKMLFRSELCSYAFNVPWKSHGLFESSWFHKKFCSCVSLTMFSLAFTLTNNLPKLHYLFYAPCTVWMATRSHQLCKISFIEILAELDIFGNKMSSKTWTPKVCS